MRIFLLGTVLTVLFTSSCATLNSSTGPSVAYLDDARQNFEAGQKALKEQDYDIARGYFDHVRTKYPYSKYAGESDLKVADSFFDEERWLEAADAYDFFIRFHPAHESLSYAYFQEATANYKAIPSNFFLFPPSETKDQTATKEALTAIDRFLEQFPKDPKVKEAQDMRADLREKMASQSIYVARYYIKAKKWKGAAKRFEEVIKDYPETDLARRTMLDLAMLKKKRLNENDEAKALLERVVKEFPDSIEAKEAQAAL